MARRIVKVTLEDRPDGGLRAYSDEIPGLVLSHSNRVKVLADLVPAVSGILDVPARDIQIDASFVTPRQS